MIIKATNTNSARTAKIPTPIPASKIPPIAAQEDIKTEQRMIMNADNL